MKPRALRHLIIALLTTSGVFHLAVALLGAAKDLTLGLTIFGFLYVALSFYVRSDTHDGSKSHSRNAIIAAISVSALGVVLGGRYYLTNGGPLALPLMLLIDIAVIVAGLFWLRQTQMKSS